jgi:hyperosmotically inducible protein
MKLNLMFLLLLISVGFAVGCERQGPMERAGESIDETAEDVGDGIDDAVNGTSDVERAGEEIDDTLEEAGDEISDMTRD